MSELVAERWKELQGKGYFANHRLYKDFHFTKPKHLALESLTGKTIAEIGCGYGRETFYLASYAKKVFAIDVTEDTLLLNQGYLEGFTNVKYVLANEYKNKIRNKLDLVYSRLVFQHIELDTMKEYIDWAYKKLKVGGQIMIQFSIGDNVKPDAMPEPIIQITKPQLKELVDRYVTINLIDDVGEGYHHIYYIGEKYE